MPKPVDVSLVLTAHHEGILAGATANSARRAIARLEAELGLSWELILVLDRANETTAMVLRSAFDCVTLRILETDEGDPGQARNHGISAAKGLCSTFLDADDLWSENWLTEAWKLIERRPDCIGHSACNMVFGDQRNLWWHVDSEGPLFDPEYLDWDNCWDAMTFARTEIYRRYPFRRNDLRLGFGHEDWHWNAWTIAEGVVHKPVAETMHFKRRRAGSQMALVERSGSIRWPLGL
jgi:glycosyltransferase involved in cell wall biosynthesis